MTRKGLSALLGCNFLTFISIGGDALLAGRFGFGPGTGSEWLRFSRSCDSWFKLIGDFHEAANMRQIH